MTGMLLGCLCEVIGYAGRVIMWNNPFSYPGFMIQISEPVTCSNILYHDDN